MSATATIDGAESKNMRLIGHSDLGGFGNGGEGMGLQKTKDGRRIMYIAHECAPINFSVFDRSGPHSQGAHYVGFMDGEYMHISSGAPDFVPTNPKDHQFYTIVDVRNPSKPEEVGRWWLPGTRQGDDVAPPVRHKKLDAGFRTHNINVYPERPDRAYAAYIDGGIIILDIADKAHPKMISRLDYHP